MKEVAVIYRNRDDWPIIEHLKKNLESVFLNYINVTNYFTSEMEENELIKGDLFLVLNEEMIYSQNKHIENLNNIVVITRGIAKKYITEIQNLPNNTDVLVVNDSYISTFQTIYIFLSLGINHVNFIPYSRTLDKKGSYNNIEIAITPNAESMVPKHIKKVINTGYRQIGYNTLITIMQNLQLNQQLIYRNIIQKMNEVVEPNTGFRSNDLLNSYLKSEMLNKVISDSNEGIILTDDKYNLVYSNNKANIIFGLSDNNYADNIKDLFDNSTYTSLADKNFDSKLIKIKEENYTIEKTPIEIMDLVIGHCMFIRNEKDLRDLELNLKKHFNKKGLIAKYTFDNIIHKSNKMNQCILLSKKAALTDYTILIQGESGTGKELLSQSIHNFSSRKDMPFVAINCASLPESLIESELFGYEGGSFTGANKNGKLGLFEQANNGTIFLDEIGDISKNLQLQLLRVIQERQIMRIGGDKLINIDVRIIVATNKNLRDEVEKGNFRNDLYYRLNVIPITIPPLRERGKDILLLFEYYLGRKYSNVSNEVKKIIESYNWQGNVRELESISKYYELLDEFPAYLMIDENKDHKTTDNIINLVLSIINDNTTKYHGIGRVKLLNTLRSHGHKIVDTELKDILYGLKDNNYVEINSGRSGNRITLEGIEYLRMPRA